MIAERHAHLQAGVHAHAVLAVEQGRHEPVEIEHEHFTHTGRLFVIGGQFGGTAAGVKVVLAHKFLAAAHGIGGEQTEPQTDRPRPREGILKQDVLTVIPRIAAEQLIGAFAGQTDGRAAALDRCTEQQQRGIHVGHAGQGAGIRRGKQGGAQRFRIEHNAVVVRVQEIGHLPDIGSVLIGLKCALRKIPVVIAVVHRPGVQGFAAGGVVSGGEHGQDGGIQSAGQEARQRHIADELAVCRIADQGVRVLDCCGKIVLVFPGFEFPVGGVGQALRGQNGKMTGQQGADLPEHTGFRRAGRSEQQQGAKAVLVDDRFDRRVAQHGVDGRAEDQSGAGGGEKQRLDAQTVAAERKTAFVLFPHGEGENAVQTGKSLRAPFQIGVQQHLGVRAAEKAVSARGKRGAQLGRVV